MYNIWNAYYHKGIKVRSRLFCPNYRIMDHTANAWIKIENTKYACNDCGCIVNIHSDYEEEEVK
jgi:Zn-finger protein